jgi:hypothetical protein
MNQGIDEFFRRAMVTVGPHHSGGDRQRRASDGDKLFPPTYEGSVYAEEARVMNGRPERCVLLDFVPQVPSRGGGLRQDQRVGSWCDLSLMNSPRGRS